MRRRWLLLFLLSPAYGADAPPVVQVRAETQPWAPGLLDLLASVGAAAPLRKDAPLTPRTGTAFWAQDGRLVTAAHTVAGAVRLSVVSEDGVSHPATVVQRDGPRDLAWLQVDLPPRPLALAEAAPGAQVAVVGFPGDRGPARLEGALVGDEARAITGPARRYLLTDIVVRPGLSGAPLLDRDGAVLGMVVAGQRTAGRDEGPALVLPADELLGAPPTPEPALELGAAPDLTWRELGLAEEGGALVVLSAPPLLRALGWTPGRRLVAVAGRAVTLAERAWLDALRGPVIADVEGGTRLILP